MDLYLSLSIPKCFTNLGLWLKFLDYQLLITAITPARDYTFSRMKLFPHCIVQQSPVGGDLGEMYLNSQFYWYFTFVLYSLER